MYPLPQIPNFVCVCVCLEHLKLIISNFEIYNTWSIATLWDIILKKNFSLRFGNLGKFAFYSENFKT